MVKAKSSKGTGLVIGLIIVASIAAFVLSMTWLQSMAKTSTYYVLREDIPAKTMLTPELLYPVVTSENSEPMNAITMEELERSLEDGTPYITQISLQAGDPITSSVVSGGEEASVEISDAIPDSWVITSFGVSADNAVGGRIRSFDYFDMLVTIEGKTYYPFVNMLALDTTVSMNDASSAYAADTEEAYEGQTSQYVVGMPPADAARLQNLMAEYSDTVRLVISPRQNNYSPPSLDDYKGAFSWNSLTPEVNYDVPDPVNLGKGAGWAMEEARKRGNLDAFGRPVEELKNCSKGNMFVPPEEDGSCPVKGVAIETETIEENAE